MNFQIAVTGWVLVLAVAAGLWIYRYVMDHKQQHETIHLHDGDAPVIASQAAISQKIHSIDVWERALTVLVLVYGIGLAVFFVVREFQRQGAGSIVGS